MITHTDRQTVGRGPFPLKATVRHPPAFLTSTAVEKNNTFVEDAQEISDIPLKFVTNRYAQSIGIQLYARELNFMITLILLLA